MTRPMRAGRRAGFTLTEMLVAMTIFGALITTTLAIFSEQIRTFASGSTQVDANQNLRFAMGVFEKDVPTAGAGLPGTQPFLVYADTHVVALNADYLSNVRNDAFAVYVDTLQPDSMVLALTRSQKFTLPLTTFQYPDTTYRVGAANSPGETIIFYFQPDASTPRTDDYLLWRQTNRMQPELIARNLLKSSNLPFFKYYRRVQGVGTNQTMDSVPTAWMPLRHTFPVHGAVADTGTVARIDNVRAVEVRFRTTDATPGAQQRIYETRRIIGLPNAGKRAARTCGDEPILGAINFQAIPDLSVLGFPAVDLTWLAATDEAAGERDVVRYVIWKSTTPLTGNEDPFVSIPSGNANYAFKDTSILPSTTYYYALAAQDCTPSLSTLLNRTVVIP